MYSQTTHSRESNQKLYAFKPRSLTVIGRPDLYQIKRKKFMPTRQFVDCQACAPRYVSYVTAKLDQRNPVGSCYVSKTPDGANAKEFSPCRTLSEGSGGPIPSLSPHSSSFSPLLPPSDILFVPKRSATH
ncbi:hypothetical protein EVAR_17293_1 [Eumeta japonica]|uniref:Uncharacterized protein n=1 Tax=Eumeta variegata TaxID=151549 RepID=A0A4C1TT29_EUMVA|nr:hypothetical protein EVAR_17293_1 [Eumeta japonica]